VKRRRRAVVVRPDRDGPSVWELLITGFIQDNNDIGRLVDVPVTTGGSPPDRQRARRVACDPQGRSH